MCIRDRYYFDVKEKTKLDALCRIIDVYDPKLAMVFCNTKKRVDDLVEMLQGRGYFAEGLHGDLKQAQRDKVMQKFRNGTIEILVATDVAARGIDVDDIDVVFNYDVPVSYTHLLFSSFPVSAKQRTDVLPIDDAVDNLRVFAVSDCHFRCV